MSHCEDFHEGILTRPQTLETLTGLCKCTWFECTFMDIFGSEKNTEFLWVRRSLVDKRLNFFFCQKHARRVDNSDCVDYSPLAFTGSPLPTGLSQQRFTLGGEYPSQTGAEFEMCAKRRFYMHRNALIRQNLKEYKQLTDVSETILGLLGIFQGCTAGFKYNNKRVRDEKSQEKNTNTGVYKRPKQNDDSKGLLHSDGDL